MSVHYSSFLIMHLRKWLTEKGKFGFSPKYESFFGHKILILLQQGTWMTVKMKTKKVTAMVEAATVKAVTMMCSLLVNKFNLLVNKK